AFDGRDDPLSTHRGYWLGLALQEGFRLPMGNVSFAFLRVVPEARFFIPLGKRFTIATRLKVGALVPLFADASLPEDASTPIVQRFTAGGPSSIRSYSIRRLAP